jgi:hypothetical protein
MSYLDLQPTGSHIEARLPLEQLSKCIAFLVGSLLIRLDYTPQLQ